jgi:predicted amidohydrolase
LRARAIETQSWVIAPGQCGEHDDNGLRHSYGHSIISNPWGTVVAECGDDEGIALAEIDLDKMRKIRSKMPVGSHRRV